jgi:cysteine synthase A
MIDKLKSISHLIANTPLKLLRQPDICLYTKLEYYNYSGSIKDRAAYNILYEAIINNQINSETLIIESSSGNFALALASMCKVLNLKFISVIDANINRDYEDLLTLLSYKVVKVTERDSTGGYLLNRIAVVKNICSETKNSFWTNQYDNPNNYLAYFHGLGEEICRECESLDFAFIGVSSGGTITGISQKLKKRFTHVKIIAVDVEGSIIFQNQPKKRYISGIGSSMVPSILQKAIIDEVVFVSELNLVKGCTDLLNEQMIFAGASTGGVYFAIKEYFKSRSFEEKPHVLFLSADRGNAYIDTVYNAEWKNSLRELISAQELQSSIY